MKMLIRVSVVFCIVLFLGCSEKEDSDRAVDGERIEADNNERMSNSNVPGNNEQGSIERPSTNIDVHETYDWVMELWQQGKKKDALEVFSSLDWQHTNVFSEDSLVKQLGSIEGEERKERVMPWVKAHGTFGSYLVKRAKAAVDRQEYALAEKQLLSLLACGHAMVVSSQDFTIQFNGYGTQTRANDALIELYKQSADVSKLEAATSRQSDIASAKRELIQRHQ